MDSIQTSLHGIKPKKRGGSLSSSRGGQATSHTETHLLYHLKSTN